MNKIVREHYPVENLPEDLRAGLEAGATVRVVVEVEEIDASSAQAELDGWARTFWALRPQDRKPLSTTDLMEQMRLLRQANRKPVSLDQAVAEIRALRDEWNDE